MEFTHIANPVRVNAQRIAKVVNNPSGTIQLDLEGKPKPYVPSSGMLARYTPAAGDYLVTQEDGYEYLNPKDVFERKYAAV